MDIVGFIQNSYLNGHLVLHKKENICGKRFSVECKMKNYECILMRNIFLAKFAVRFFLKISFQRTFLQQRNFFFLVLKLINIQKFPFNRHLHVHNEQKFCQKNYNKSFANFQKKFAQVKFVQALKNFLGYRNKCLINVICQTYDA